MTEIRDDREKDANCEAEKRKKQTIAWETINVDSLLLMRVSYSHVDGVHHTVIRVSYTLAKPYFRFFHFSLFHHLDLSRFVVHTLSPDVAYRRFRWYSYGTLDRLIHRITTVWPSVRNQRMLRNNPALNIIRVIFRFSQLDGTVIFVRMGGGRGGEGERL